MTRSSLTFGLSRTTSRAACVRPCEGLRLQHQSPLPRARAAGHDGLMQGDAGRDRGARRGNHASRARGREAGASWLFRVVALLGLRAPSFLVAVLRGSGATPTSTGALSGLWGHAGPATGPRAAPTLVRDGRCRSRSPAQRSGPKPPLYRDAARPSKPTRCGAGSGASWAGPSGYVSRASPRQPRAI